MPLLLVWLLGVLTAANGSSTATLCIGFLRPSAERPASPHDAAALAFAETRGTVLRLYPAQGGGWSDETGAPRALEECDVIWAHDGDLVDREPWLDAAAKNDLSSYLEGGGALLLSGAAGRLLNDLGIEKTPLRVLGTSGTPVASGIRVPEAHRGHPLFEGLDLSHPMMLTSRGCNALADFYGTAGPHGELLADGNGTGERPVVEYHVGEGRVLFIGWRLADFTTSGDTHRPQFERFFGNALHHLASVNANRARPIRPKGKTRYVRRLGIPFLMAERPTAFREPATNARTAVLLEADRADAVREMPAGDAEIRANCLALTLSDRERPVARFLEKRRTEQEAQDRRDRDLIGQLRIVRPVVTFEPGPLQPLRMAAPDQSVLLGRSPFMAPGEGRGDVNGPGYEPIEDGGFRIAGGKRQLNRPIVHGQNRVWTGDVPLFRMDTVTGNGSYARQERVFPLWPRPDAHIGGVNPCMGTLRLGVPGAAGKIDWLEDRKDFETTFRPGYTEYRARGVRVAIAPSADFHGLVCQIEFDSETSLAWRYGGIWWQPGDANTNRVQIAERIARFTEQNLPNGLVLAGWDGEGPGHAVETPHGQDVEFVASVPRRIYHVVAAWGITGADQERLQQTLGRLDTPNASAWPKERDALKALWKNCYVDRALEPEKHLRQLLAAPADELRRTRELWDGRRSAFQIRTPDAHCNALINWARCTSDYHRQGPGLVLGAQIWQMYSHISTGWYGKQWGGDHATMAECLRFYAAMQGEDGFIRWISPSLVAFNAENNSAYWVDQVWRHFEWTGDRRFIADMWPAVRKAVSWMRTRNDPDGDGLFRDAYEYWNCDSNGKGPKSSAPSAMAWAMLDRAARMARVLGDMASEAEFRALAEKTRAAIFRELWNEKEGRLGCIGSDGMWRGHPQTWEEYLAINAGLLSPAQGRRAMRWLETHYGFEPRPGVTLLSCSDWWPIRWSCQWVPTGDTCLAALAGMKSGDADLWWPYLRTVLGSAFRSEFPGINMGIANTGVGGGDREDVDSVDPHVHVAVRGLFGIEPALHEGRIAICPAFPSDWQQASISTPDLSYEWRRDGNRAIFHIRTPKPTVKRVRASLGGEEKVTPSEVESVVTVEAGPQPPPMEPAATQTISVEQQPASSPPPVSEAERARQILFDFGGAFNVTIEDFAATKFTFDHADSPAPITGWWGNPRLTWGPSPRVLDATNGVRFLTSGRRREELGPAEKNLLALSSWRPHPLPAGARISVGEPCERLWLLLQSYVHPMRNYVPNGEIVLHYADGGTSIISLVPPFNLDCYFQHFSREGIPVELGQCAPSGRPFSFVPEKWIFPHADALRVPCDPKRALESVELRATCGEGVLAIAGMTAIAAEP